MNRCSAKRARWKIAAYSWLRLASQVLSQYHRGVHDPQPPQLLPRLDRWLGRRGRGLPALTNDGAALLDRRLTIRRRALAVALAVSAPSATAWILSISSSNLDQPGPANGAAVAWLAVALALAAVAVLTWSVLLRVGERRLAATLTRRVSRDTALPLWRQLGVLRSANCLAIALACCAVLTALIATHADLALIATFAALFVLIATLSGIAFWELVHAPAIAIDEATLAADQRLRRQNVYNAVYPLGLLLASAPATIVMLDGADNHGLQTVAVLAMGLNIAVYAIEALAQLLEQRDGFRRLLRRWRPAA
jgi:hypothetical protein